MKLRSLPSHSILIFLLGVTPVVAQRTGSGASEHPGKEHPGKEHPGKEHPGKEHPGKEHPGKEHPGKEHPGKEHPGKEHPGKEHPGKEHPGKEHPGSGLQEHPGEAVRDKLKDRIKAAMSNFIRRDTRLHGGYFFLLDAQMKDVWWLRHQTVHDYITQIKGNEGRRVYGEALSEGVIRSGSRSQVFFACNDFVDQKGRKLDVDVWLVYNGSSMRCAEFRIHKVDGKARYSFRDDKPVATSN